MPNELSLTPAIAALALALVMTPVVRAFARRFGVVAAPKADRWHTKPTAMLGGIAIFIAVTVPLALFLPHTKETWAVIGASAALFVLGLVDDFLHIKPYQKLIGQLLGAATVVYFGLTLPWTGSATLNLVITFFWLVGVTNAVNMLDNMDGLAAGVSSIAAFFLAANFWMNGQPNTALMLATFGAALLGFLVFNHNPASIFMGDCGSMFVGFFLASSALLAQEAGGGRSRSLMAVLAVPVLVLFIPIFDTTFVTVMRKLSGRAASQGGRDHTSHRLVALGLTERRAVWMLYFFAITAGTLSLVARNMEFDLSIAIIAVFTTALALLGVYLAKVRVYSDEEVARARQKPLVSFLVDLSYKRRVFEVFLDVVLVVIAYYMAHVAIVGPLRFDLRAWEFFISTLPIVIFVKLATFLAAGVYRGLWRYTSISDVTVFSKAVVASSLVSFLIVVVAFQFEGYSRRVFVVDAVLLLSFVTMSRLAFRVLRLALPGPHSVSGKRVLIFGAGDGGELLCRELINNEHLQRVPVAFIDDDPVKAGRVVHGLRVHAATEPLERICREQKIDEIMLSTTKVTMSRLRSLVASCETVNIPVVRMSINIDRIADFELGWVLPSSGDDRFPLTRATQSIPVRKPADTPVAHPVAPISN